MKKIATSLLALSSLLYLTAAYYPNTVTSRAAKELVVRARVTGGSPPSVTSQSGSWLTYTSRTGAGDYTFTITAGTFAADPACEITMLNAASRGFSRAVTMTGSSLRTVTEDSAGTGRDTDLSIVCMGPR